MTKTALVLGASGGVGGETARALIAHGWRVRGLSRTPRTDDADGDGIEWITGDAMDADAVLRAAQGVQAIVHAANPPGYQHWDTVATAMLANSIAAARAVDARLALPGNVYVYNVNRVPLAAPDTVQAPVTRKGRIRVEMEQSLIDSGVRSLLLRAGDFFGPRPGGSWFSQGMITPGKPIRSVMNPVARGVGHAWAYLPDVGETFARLLDAEERLPHAARFHFDGVWDADGTELIAAVGRATGQAPKVRSFPWMLLPLLAPFNAMMRELVEMRPLWKKPLRLDNRSLVAFLGEEPRTTLDEAMGTTLKALGCLG